MKINFITFSIIFLLLSACGGSGFVISPNYQFDSISEGEVTSTSIGLYWETSLVSHGQVEYGETADLGQTIPISSQSFEHQINLSNLNKFTQYFYRIHSFSNDEEIVSEIRSFKTEPHDLDLSSAVLASNFGFDESNATEALRAAINSPDPIIVIDKQSADWNIDPLKVFNVTNKTIVVEEGVTIKARVNAFEEENAVLLNFSLPKNVSFLGYGANLMMNKDEYISGEGRHALVISGAEDFTIEGFTISDSGGDGMYIAGSVFPHKNYSENVYVDNVIFDNHRRQGMSIISAENVYVSNSSFLNTNGVLPEAGVDLEPNRVEERLINIHFDHCRFINNNHAGFVLAAINLDETSLPISVTVKNSYFSMNHDISNSYSKGELAFGANRLSPVQGEVLFENIEFDGSEWGLFKSRIPAEAYTVNFKNVHAQNMLQTPYETEGGLINFEVPSYSEEGTLGNFHFDNITAQYERNLPVFYIYDFSTLIEVKNISANVFINHPENPDSLIYRNGYTPIETNIEIYVEHVD